MRSVSIRTTMARASGYADFASLGHARHAPFQRRFAAHAQREARIENEECAATHDDAPAVPPEREHDLGQFAHVVARRESPDADELVDPSRDALSPSFVERLDDLAPHVRLLGDLVDQLLRIEGEPEPLGYLPSTSRRALRIRARCRSIGPCSSFDVCAPGEGRHDARSAMPRSVIHFRTC